MSAQSIPEPDQDKVILYLIDNSKILILMAIRFAATVKKIDPSPIAMTVTILSHNYYTDLLTFRNLCK